MPNCSPTAARSSVAPSYTSPCRLQCPSSRRNASSVAIGVFSSVTSFSVLPALHAAPALDLGHAVHEVAPIGGELLEALHRPVHVGAEPGQFVFHLGHRLLDAAQRHRRTEHGAARNQEPHCLRRLDQRNGHTASLGINPPGTPPGSIPAAG